MPIPTFTWNHLYSTGDWNFSPLIPILILYMDSSLWKTLHKVYWLIYKHDYLKRLSLDHQRARCGRDIFLFSQLVRGRMRTESENLSGSQSLSYFNHWLVIVLVSWAKKIFIWYLQVLRNLFKIYHQQLQLKFAIC